MKLKIMSSLAALFILFFFVASVSAQNQTSQAYWHNSDYYSIQLNGVGSGFVSVEMNLQSISKSAVSAIVLSIPYPNVTIYRVISMNGSYYSGCGGNYPCPAYGSSAYPSIYPYYNNTPQFINYTTANLANSTTLTLYLNRPLLNNSQTTIYLFFSTKSLAQKTFQGYQFSFKTIIDNNALIRDAYASVEVPQNMYLKGKQSFNISYATESAQGALISATSPSAVGALLPALFYGGYQYQASDLLAGEYFTVSGVYGSNRVLLYLPEIFIAVVIIVMVAVLIQFVLVSKIKRIFSIRKSGGVRKMGDFTFTRPILVGAFSGFIFQIVYYAFQALYGLANFSYYYNSPLPILFALLGLIVYGLALFGLPYYLYSRFNKKEGVLAGLISIMASIIYFIILLYLLQPTIVPYGLPLAGVLK